MLTQGRGNTSVQSSGIGEGECVEWATARVEAGEREKCQSVELVYGVAGRV